MTVQPNSETTDIEAILAQNPPKRIEDLDAEESLEQDQEEPENEYSGDDAIELSDTEEEDQDQEEEEGEAFYTVKIDGKEEQVSLNELLNGFQRQADYTRKTQEIAEMRKGLETQKNEVSDLAKNYQENLKIALEFIGIDAEATKKEIKSLAEAEDWDGVKGLEYAQSQRIEAARLIQGELQKLEQQQQERQKKEIEQYRQAEVQKLARLNPELATDKGRDRLNQYMKNQGFTDQEIQSLLKAEGFLLVEKARKWDALQAKKPAPDGRPIKAIKGKKVRVGDAQRQATEQAKLREALASARDRRSREDIGIRLLENIPILKR